LSILIADSFDKRSGQATLIRTVFYFYFELAVVLLTNQKDYELVNVEKSVDGVSRGRVGVHLPLVGKPRGTAIPSTGSTTLTTGPLRTGNTDSHCF
jgi:hypothetical protein